MNTLRLKWAVIAVLLILLRSVVGSTNAMGQEMPDGALSGIFSISNGQFVNFSQGNLQYIGSEGWFYYDDGSLQSAIGFNTEEASFEWANMYPASLVAPYAGSMMTQVSFICYDAWNYHQSGIYTIKIYLGGDEAPETLVHTQDYEFDGIFTGDWVVVDLTTPVALDGSQNLWIALYNDAVEGHLRYPASYSNSGTGDVNGRWFCSDGGDWRDVNSVLNIGSWMIRGIVSSTDAYWKFADHQWDCLGDNGGQCSSINSANRDLFGWGTSGYNHGSVCYQPWSVSDGGEYADDYLVYGGGSSGLFDNTGQADWGYNAIANGGNQENSGWRTLRQEEWKYIINSRTTPTGIRWAKGTVNGVNGLILLPDTWSSSYYALNDANGGGYGSNIITASDWVADLEANGAVFLPAAGYREVTSLVDFGTQGFYWSASCGYYSNFAYDLTFGDEGLYFNEWGWIAHGKAVRLVRPSQKSLFSINVTSNPVEGGEVSGGGICVEGTDCTLTATANEGWIFLNWTDNGEVVSANASYTFTVNRERNLRANFRYAGANISNGVLTGNFSVGEGRQVRFSQGNLQYIGSAGNDDEHNTGAYWKFAEHQWDYLGNNGQGSDLKTANRDLFGWGTSGYNHGAVCYQPWSVSRNDDDYWAYGDPAFNLFDQTGQADWGYNAIANGGNQENSGWRTLKRDEWDYLFNSRTTLSGIRWVKGTVNGVNGVILLPDTWLSSYYALNDANGGTYNSNTITVADWANSLEANGAVFLPAYVWRVGTSIYTYYLGEEGYYWASDIGNNNYPRYVWFSYGELYTHNAYQRNLGHSVRLVRPAQNGLFVVNVIANPAVGGEVSEGGVYPEGALCTFTASANEGYTFVNWTANGEVVSTETSFSCTITSGKTFVANFRNDHVNITDGVLGGHFSVSENQQVGFSQGNLLYIGSVGNGDENNTGAYWKFAEHQWDYLGNNGQGSDSRMANRDLFGWGTSGYDHGAVRYQPWSAGGNYEDYCVYGDPAFNLFDQTGQADWGYNAIANGGNQENNGWRTLKREEWDYLINTRTTVSGIRWVKGTVNGVNGVILLPDTWLSSYYTLNDANGGSYDSNTITADDWANSLEANGAVFLPAGGAYENYIYGAGFGGAYWSSSEYSNEYSYAISFYDNNLDANWDPFRKNGLSVRLVRPTQNGIFGINAVPNPLEAGEVIGSGAYPEGAVCSLTASANEGYTFVNWTWNGEVLSTEATYSFTVTGGKTLVANFHYIDVENSDGALAGHFSVSEGRQVFFSQGNLQYIGSAGNGDENNTGAYWKFAEHQWDYLGNNGQGSDSRMANRDLFGWGTSGYNQGAVCYQPWSVNTYSYDYLPFGSDICGLFGQTGQAEWGYNPIINGGNQENDGWRTLTNEEWNYLINTRETESGIRWTRAKVNGVNGMILLPDTWSLSYYTLNDANGGSYGSNIITATDWFAALEANGAIFLPAAGYRSGTSVGSVGSYGYYWSASPWEEYGYYIHCIYYNGNYLDTYNAYVRSYGQSVRLVRSAQNNSYSISAISDPLEGGAISGEGTYLDGFHCTLTATANEGFAFANWTENGEVVSSDATYGFTVTGDRNLEAHFVLPFVVTVSTDPEEGGTVTGEGEYVYGAECTLTAMANEGYAFVNWTENGEVVSSDATYTFTVTEDRDLVANFVDGVIGYTYFDWQTNNGAITRTVVWPDGKVSFGFTTASDGSYSDRGTGIGSYDTANDEWIPSEGRVENEKTGFGSIARYGANGIVVAAHTADECHVFIVPDKDNIPVNAVSAVSCLDNTYVPAWPNVMTSGSNRQIIHVIASASSGTIPGMENVSQPLIYFRSTDGGQTWDKQNIVLPYMGAEYSPFWQANCCYWMETTDDNCLALVVNNEWSDGMVLYSYDDGETWQRKVFYKHPDPFGHFGVPFVDQFFYYPRWTSCQWDSQHHLHVLYEFHTKWGEAGSNSYAPGSGGVAYWNETMPYNSEGTTASAIEGNLVPGQPFVMESAYLYNDIYRSWWHFGYEDAHEMWPEYLGYLAPLTDDGDPEDPYQATGFNIQNTESHGIYNSGVCAFPVLCMVPGTDEMVAVWSALDENHTDANGRYYYKLFASYSNDGGVSWSPMVHLTHDAMFNNAEFIYNQAAVVGRKLIIATQTDAETGSYVMNADYNGSNNFYKGFVFDIDALFDIVTLPDVDQELMLTSGWNWISSYVEYRPESLAEMQELIASECESAMVKSQNDGYVSYAEESWTGSLSTMDNAQMYLVLVDHDIPLMFFGPQSNPAGHPITLKPGWNWIGYPLTVPMELSEALSGLQPEDGDLIKGSSGYAIYDALEDKWAGNLTTLEPGKGYIYLSVSEENRVFVFPSER